MNQSKVKLGVILLSAIALAGCSQSSSTKTERDNAQTLVKVAQKFNDDYRDGNFGSVYDRWNAPSQAIIRRSDYIRRHVECPNNSQAPVHVLSVRRGIGDTWLVSYTISDLNFSDYWSYSEGRWQFDLLKSNPAAVKLYRLPVAQYALNLGCVRG